MRPRRFTQDQVHAFRTAGKRDSAWARLLKCGANAVRYARVGYNYKDHPTPPDVQPRRRGVCG